MQIQERFAPAAGVVSALFSLIPSIIKQLDISELPKLSEDLTMYDDVPHFCWYAVLCNQKTIIFISL